MMVKNTYIKMYTFILNSIKIGPVYFTVYHYDLIKTHKNASLQFLLNDYSYFCCYNVFELLIDCIKMFAVPKD